MTGSPAVASPSAQKRESRQARLRRASLAMVIVLIVQFGLGIAVKASQHDG
jgi:hypothetical protein